MVKLFSKNSNLCDHSSPTSQTDRQTDRQTTCDRNTALCTKVHRVVKTQSTSTNIVIMESQSELQCDLTLVIFRYADLRVISVAETALKPIKYCTVQLPNSTVTTTIVRSTIVLDLNQCSIQVTSLLSRRPIRIRLYSRRKKIGISVASEQTALYYITFYQRDAMLARVIVIATCLSVRLSVRPSVRHTPVLCQNEESQRQDFFIILQPQESSFLTPNFITKF